MSVVEREEVVRVTDAERRARVLEAAALEMEVRGFGRWGAVGDDGSVCLGGAVECALGFDDSPRVLVNWSAVWDVWGGQPSLWPFNDEPGRTADEVTFLLRWRAEEIRDGWDARAPEGR